MGGNGGGNGVCGQGVANAMAKYGQERGVGQERGLACTPVIAYTNLVVGFAGGFHLPGFRHANQERCAESW
jgi:hypothetical protein